MCYRTVAFLPPKRLVTRTRVATLLALPAGAITEPVATDHKPELNEIFGCSYGSHPVPSLDFDEDDERDEPVATAPTNTVVLHEGNAVV